MKDAIIPEKSILSPEFKNESRKLIIKNPQRIIYNGSCVIIEILGSLPMDFSNMKVTICIINPYNKKKNRVKIDLFDSLNVKSYLLELAEKEGHDFDHLESDFADLTDLLELHREKLFDQESSFIIKGECKSELNRKSKNHAFELLQKPNLLLTVDKLLENSGIVGEKNARQALFIIASSYKTPYPLHSIVQGESGSGKSHLVNLIADCIPQEDVLNVTRITSKALYYFEKNDLINKLVVIQDFEGLDDNAKFAFRELQSSGYLSTSFTSRDKSGNLKAKLKQVSAHISSIVATSKAEIYYDNLSRSIIIGVDESTEQTEKIITHQNNLYAGILDKNISDQAKFLLRNCIRLLKPCEVVNPFANKIKLPAQAKMMRRLNHQFNCYIANITILNQYQREKDSYGRLITTREDIKTAIDTFFECIFLKVDDLDSSTRQFFEKLKKIIKLNQKAHSSFSQSDVRYELNISKTMVNKYFLKLQKLNYLQISSGTSNRGYQYLVTHFDDLEKFKSKMKKDLNKQIRQF